MQHAVIMAGGSGTRLWPLSRRSRPKQLMRLFDGASLLQLAARRLEPIFDPQHIWVITSEHHLDQVASELPQIPRERLIGEPIGRDTANAIGLAAAIIAQEDLEATMAVFTADHLISPVDAFTESIRIGLNTVQQHPEALVTWGITPTEAHTGYGYIRRGANVSSRVFRVEAFKEKPTREVAQQYLAAGDCYWNSGMFAWKTGTILRELAQRLPDNEAILTELASNWRYIAGTPECRDKFQALEPISIDYAVLEHADPVLVVEMNSNWRDVGTWSALAATQAGDQTGNRVIAPQSLLIDAANNTIISEDEHLIVALGVDDLIVVHSPDATLICRREDEDKLKSIIAQRQERFGDTYE
jgi:mannose-1-phosphate guanylyltransferase